MATIQTNSKRNNRKNGNKLFATANELLVVFVHGFRGSETSFSSFPADALRSLFAFRRSKTNPKIDARILPAFPSTGPLQSASARLYNYLAMNAIDRPVVIISHSMGGLIAANTLIQASAVDPPPFNICAIVAFDSPFYGLNATSIATGIASNATALVSSYIPETMPSFLDPSSIASSISSIVSQPQTATKETENDASKEAQDPPADPQQDPQQNLSKTTQKESAEETPLLPGAPAIPSSSPQAILIASNAHISFDASDPQSDPNAPIHDYVISNSVNSENIDEAAIVAAEAESQLAVPTDSQTDSKCVLESTPNPNEPSEAASMTVSSDLASSRGPELIPVPTDSGWNPWLTFGLSAAAIAAGAYYSGGLLAIGSFSVARRIAAAYAISHADEARKHLQFLYPIWGEPAQQTHDRMNAILNLVQNRNLFFKCFYVQVPKQIQAAAGSSSDLRTFIRLPPLQTSHLFFPIGTDHTDEISAHMAMFSRDTNPGHYWQLVDETAKFVSKIIDHFFKVKEQDAA